MFSFNNFKLISRKYSNLSQFIPKHKNVCENDVEKLRNFIENSPKILVLTGAGISTESGIPDYRSEDVGLYERRQYKPVKHQEFCSSFDVRQRYWARNFIGWYNFSQCEPNVTHFSIRNLELEHKKITSVVTQNVDNLHFKAGSQSVVELHGSAYRVVCLNCSEKYDRFYVQKQLEELNPSFTEVSEMIRPDGDVEISTERLSEFHPPVCEKCQGVLKPDIVFFGDNVPRKRVEYIRNQMEISDALLILGSSVTVFSSYRIVLQALEENKKICIVNIGPTRADQQVELKISARCGEILPMIC